MGARVPLSDRAGLDCRPKRADLADDSRTAKEPPAGLVLWEAPVSTANALCDRGAWRPREARLVSIEGSATLNRQRAGAVSGRVETCAPLAGAGGSLQARV